MLGTRKSLYDFFSLTIEVVLVPRTMYRPINDAVYQLMPNTSTVESSRDTEPQIEPWTDATMFQPTKFFKLLFGSRSSDGHDKQECMNDGTNVE